MIRNWPGENFNSRIPEGLGSLSELVFIDLGYNSLTGSLPLNIGGLSSLETLILNFNSLNGTVPDSLATLPLKSLNVLVNQFTGGLGDGYSRLISCNLSNNSMCTGASANVIPSICGTLFSACD
jgi:hypothetical protein